MQRFSLMCAVAALEFAGGCTTSIHDMNATTDLQGTWTCLAATVDGNNLPEETVKMLRLTLTADRYKTEKGAQVLFDSTYTIDALAEPKEINIVGTEGDLKGRDAQGIYALEGDRLRICYTMPGLERPQKFESTAGSKAHLLVLERR